MVVGGIRELGGLGGLVGGGTREIRVTRWTGGVGGLGELLFQNSFLGQKHHRCVASGTRGSRGD